MRPRVAISLAVVLATPLTIGGGAAAPISGSGAGSAGASLFAANRISRESPGPALAEFACPSGTLPEGPDVVCVHLPADDEGAPAAETQANAHRDRTGNWVVYDQIPRRPDRPEEYDSYRLPVACERRCVVSGYDLDRPDRLQRRGPGLSYVGHGAIDIAVARGTPVFVPKLEHQDGPAEVVYVGPLFGTTVVTLHSLREGAALREYLVLFAHLDAAAASVVAGKRVGADEPIGFVGDTGAPGLVHLHLEVRRVRAGVDVRALVRLSEGAGALVNDARTVACDPRNVLPLRVSSSVALP